MKNSKAIFFVRVIFFSVYFFSGAEGFYERDPGKVLADIVQLAQQHTLDVGNVQALCEALNDTDMLDQDLLNAAFEQAISCLKTCKAFLSYKELEDYANDLEVAFDSMNALLAHAVKGTKRFSNIIVSNRAVAGTVTVTGSETIGGNLTIGGNQTIKGNLVVLGTSILTTATSVITPASGISQLDGGNGGTASGSIVTLDGDANITVTGNNASAVTITLNPSVSVAGSITAGDGLNVTGGSSTSTIMGAVNVNTGSSTATTTIGNATAGTTNINGTTHINIAGSAATIIGNATNDDVSLSVVGGTAEPAVLMTGDSSLSAPALRLINNPTSAASDFVLTIDSNGNVKKTTTTFGTLGGNLAITTDNGTATGSTINLNAQPQAGGTVTFSASGATVLLNTTDGNGNTAIGDNSSAGGGGSIAIGSAIAGYAGDTNPYSIAIGNGAQADNTSSSTNGIAIGQGAQAQCSVPLGDTAYSYDIAIGTGAQANGGNCIVIGNGHASVVNSIIIGNTDIANEVNGGVIIYGIYGYSYSIANNAPVYVDSTGTLGTMASARRFKENFRNMDKESGKLYKLNPVKFDYKEEYGGNKNQFGLIAEEVAQHLPDLIIGDKKGEIYSVAYHVLPSLLLNEVQKHQHRLDAQEKKHQQEMDELRAAIVVLQAALK